MNTTQFKISSYYFTFFIIIISTMKLCSTVDSVYDCLSKTYNLTNIPCSHCDERPLQDGACKDFPIKFYTYEQPYPPFGNRSTLKVEVTLLNESLLNDTSFYINVELTRAYCPNSIGNCDCSERVSLNGNCSNKFKLARFGAEYSNLDDDNYCAVITFGNAHNGRLCQVRDNTSYQFKSVKEEASVVGPSDNKVMTIAVICLGVVVAAVIVIFALIMLRKRRARRENTTRLPVPPYVTQDTERLDKVKVKVFLIYYHDCIHHSAAVKSLAELLNENNCDVLYDAVDLNELAINPVGWVAQNLTSRNKIIIVNSSGAHQCYNLWLNNHRQNLNQDIFDSTFLTAIVELTMNEDMRHDYSRIIHIRFNYTNKDNVIQTICRGRHFEVPEDLDQLLSHIHGPDIVLEKIKSDCTHFQRLTNHVANAAMCRC